VDLINAEHADFILVAGDIIDISTRPLVEEEMAKEFRRLNAPVYACLGNHEYYSNEPKARRFYQEAGIRLLQDSCAAEGALCIIGRYDRTNSHRKPTAKILSNLDLRHPIILLDHQPYHLKESERAGVDFQLSGHTHRGQVFPINIITDVIYECSHGYHRLGRTHYYVSEGIGLWGGKFRIGSKSEYTVVTLKGTRP
jgi:predicted MPP superfamily phosphohydrolase